MITAHRQLEEGRRESLSVKWRAESVIFDQSQFLAAVSRDLQQPMQTLSRLRGTLAEKVKDKEALNLIARLNEAASVLADRLDTLLDLNRPEAAIVSGQKNVEPWQPVMPAEPRRDDAQGNPKPTIFVVDDERSIREAMPELFRKEGWSVEIYPNGEAFLKAYRPGREGCLVIDARMPGMSGLELLTYLKAGAGFLPTIMMTGHADIRLAVRAMKAGAVGFLEKPVQSDELLANIKQALELARNSAVLVSFHAEAAKRIAGLTARERQVMKLVVEGNPNKQIAYVLGINQRTVETHRATVMKKIGARSLPELIHLTIAGSPRDSENGVCGRNSLVSESGATISACCD